MADFSTILQSADIRAVVQENALERAFHDSLFPRLLFRAEALPQPWPANVGDTMVFTAAGLIRPKTAPLVPGTDPIPSNYPKEQWTAMLNQYADSIDTHMPTSIVAIANLFLRNAQQLGLSAGQSLNRLVRNRLYNAALSGWTVTSAAGAAVTAIPVQRLVGFTRARRPDLTTGNAVKYDYVGTGNPLPITVSNAGTPQNVNVINWTPQYPGDEVGPGTLTVDAAVTFGARDYVYSSDRTNLQRLGGSNLLKSDAIPVGTLLTLAAIRSAVGRFRMQNVPEFADGFFHAHLDPTSEAQIFSDAEFRSLLTGLPDYFVYRNFAIGQVLGTVFFRNNEVPSDASISGQVVGSNGATTTGIYDPQDQFGADVWLNNAINTTRIHRPIFVGQGAIYEYYQDLMQLVTEAGITGKLGEPRITNNGIEVNTDRIQLIIRAPLNRLQDLVSTSWKFIGDWPVRTDGVTGDAARYKRLLVIEHTE